MPEVRLTCAYGYFLSHKTSTNITKNILLGWAYILKQTKFWSNLKGLVCVYWGKGDNIREVSIEKKYIYKSLIAEGSMASKSLTYYICQKASQISTWHVHTTSQTH